MAKGESGESVRRLYDIFISLEAKFISKTKNPIFWDFPSNYLLYIVLCSLPFVKCFMQFGNKKMRRRDQRLVH